MRIKNDALWTAAAMGVATITTEAVPLDHIYGYSVQLVWTGTPVGTFTLEASNDSPGTGVQPGNWTPTNWDAISGASKAAGGAAGSHMWDITVAMYKWVRIKYVGTGSSGTVTARINIKGM
jgi:hypothetical protein